jgi:endonuclease/exonuclease/phosphatase family metal-dependent hydrolase
MQGIHAISTSGSSRSAPTPGAASAAAGALRQTTGERVVRLLTLNIHKGFSLFNRRFVLHDLREAVRKVPADIVLLQEVIGDHGGHAQRQAGWPDTPHYEFLADSLWPEFAYGRNAVYTQGHHGNAVLSKFPIVRYHNHDVSVGDTERRGLLHCVLNLPGPDLPMHVVCVHLGLGESQRRHQLQQLCALIRREVPNNAPLFVGGDFNDWRQRADDLLGSGAGLREAFSELKGNPARSFPAFWPLLRLDRLYLRDGRVRQARVLSGRPWSRLSDHAALSVEIEL